MRNKNILPVLSIILSLVLLLPACKKSSTSGSTPVKSYSVTLGNVGNASYGNLFNIATGNVYSCSNITDSASSAKADIVQGFYATSGIIDFDAPASTNTGCATTFIVKQPTSLMAITLDTASFNAIQYDAQLQTVVNNNTGAFVGNITIGTPPYAILVKTFAGVYAVVMCTNIVGTGSSANSYVQYNVKVMQ